MIKETGGQAFPQQKWDYDRQNNVLQYQEEGIALRDYFAAKAMQGYLSNSWQAKEMDKTGDSASEQMCWFAEASYAMADAMIKARGE